MGINEVTLKTHSFIKTTVGDGFNQYVKNCKEKGVYILVDSFKYVWIEYSDESLEEPNSVGIGQLTNEELENLIKILC